MGSKKSGLSPKQRTELEHRKTIFVQEYLKDFSGKYAAIRAGYSPKAAEVPACNLLKRSDVKEMIEKEMAKRSARTGVTADKVVLELAKIAFANVRNIADKDLNELTEEDAAAINNVIRTVNVQRKTTTYRYYLKDQLKALELLMKHLGMININVKGNIDINFRDLSDDELDKNIKELEAYLQGHSDSQRTIDSGKAGKNIKANRVSKPSSNNQ